MSEIIITEKNFDSEVLNSDKPVLLDFWAGWCGPCKMLSPVIRELSDEYGDKIKVGKVNVDEEMNLALKYNIAAIPTVMLFENGNIKNTLVGYHDKGEIASMLK